MCQIVALLKFKFGALLSRRTAQILMGPIILFSTAVIDTIQKINIRLAICVAKC